MSSKINLRAKINGHEKKLSENIQEDQTTKHNISTKKIAFNDS
jgi:hypothetical protein